MYVIDAYAQFFRAYHAIRNQMTSPVTKEPTNATFGFVGMLLKLFRECNPDYVVVAYDKSGDQGTFRSQLYPEYKANRDAPPEDFKPQAHRCLDLLRAIGIPTIGVDGFEADDVIATLAKRIGADAEGYSVRIVSKDKDLQQLLVPFDPTMGGVEMYDIHTERAITADSLKEDKGILPHQVVDMLALMGDTVDNVPGVPGIGATTAAELVAQYQSIEGIEEELQRTYDTKSAYKIKGKRRENLIAAYSPDTDTGESPIMLSRKLVQLDDNVPFDLSIRDAATESFELHNLLPILKELGFNRFQDELNALLGEESNPQETPSSTSTETHSEGDSDTGAAGTLFAASSEPAEPTFDFEHLLVSDSASLNQLTSALEHARNAGTVIAVDTETTALRPMEAHLAGISFAWKQDGSRDNIASAYVPIRSPQQDSHLDEHAVLSALSHYLEDPVLKKTGHNLKYDVIVLRRAGVSLRGVANDTMVSSYLIDASRSSHSMDALALALLNHQCISIKRLIGTGKNQKRFDEVPLDQAAPYAAEDAWVSLKLHHALDAELRSLGLGELLDAVELPLIGVLAELEYNGITVDPDELERQRAKLSERIVALKSEIEDAAPRPFNPDSPKQLSSVLFNAPDLAEEPGLGITPIKKTKTGFSTDAETLEKLTADPEVDSSLPRLIVEYRQLTKLVNTYLVALANDINKDTKRVHASFNQTVAATGRLSSSDPNLQNIPIRTQIGRDIRRAFVAAPPLLTDVSQPYTLISADYSQIELRVLAHLSEDANLIAAFEAGEDIHRAVAAQINNVNSEDVTPDMRSGAKQVNFGIVYGITPYGLARRIGISNAEATDIITGYKQRFPGITEFLDSCVLYAKEHGYVETILKRRRPISEIDARNPARRALAERMAINSVVQGSAADLIKLAMVKIQSTLEQIKSGNTPTNIDTQTADALTHTTMLLQIHDELVFECPESHAAIAAEWLVKEMEAAMQLRVPIVVDHATGRSWYDGK